jgi:SPP1 family predicted phage head-tail adaptor
VELLMHAGRLRHLVTLQENQPTIDPVDGAETDNWVEIQTVWGELRTLSGKEYLASRESHADLTGKIRIRYRAGLEPLRWRAIVSDQTYNIEYIGDVDGRRRELELWVSRIL